LHGVPVHLERRPFELLVLLVSHAGHLVNREDVIRQLWPARVVIDFDTGLNTLVRKVRKALGDSAENPQFVETVARLGYRFIAPVSAYETAPAIEVPLDESKAAGHRSKAVLVVAAAALLLVALGAGVWRAVNQPPSHISIAVLPFENLTGSEELAYLAAGLAEETSVSFSAIDFPGLVVIGRVSAMALADSSSQWQAIGRDNEIDYVVQSSLRREGARIRVTSRLIRVADSQQVWTASFDRELTNTLGLQRELSIAIAEQVRLRLSPEVAAEIEQRQTRNPKAYEWYLKGRYEWTQFKPNSVARALAYYQQAVDLDPGYALAWAGISRTLSTSIVTRGTAADAVQVQAEDALQRALEFGPNLAETQLALGSYYFFMNWDFVAAEAAGREAVKLDPNNAMSYMFLGIVLATSGKPVEARSMLQRARELDPLFPLVFANSANVALIGGDPEAAVEFATQAIAIDPEFWVGYYHLGSAQLALGNLNAALEAHSTAEKLSEGNAQWSIAARGHVLARLGREDDARDVLATLAAQSVERHIAPYTFAVVYAGFGDADLAFEWLERALTERDIALMHFAMDPQLAPLRDDTRFESLARRCKCTPMPEFLPATLKN
jgi:TolB-like protein/DNA-binding winged helix-turn-helix (wHTH) protein/Flp pilus assembly protein TadD